MNSNCTELKITPFRLFSSAASRDFKRRLATKIQMELSTIDITEDCVFSTIKEDAALAQEMLEAQTATRRQ